MVNEFIYCPRLFHLEWVQSRFATSDDVEEGLYVHRVVDEPSGDLPQPDEHLEMYAGRKSRSFWLSSIELGLTAKLDVVEVDEAGGVVLVDYKKGAPDPRGRVWDTDRVQSLIQALLLQDAGYTVPQAEVWYAETRQRLSIAVSDGTLTEIRAVLKRLQNVAADPRPPLPLVNSPKCPKCSLVGICLPDEVTSLQNEATPPRPRRLMAADPDNRPVYVQEQGTVVGVRRGRLEVFKDGKSLISYRLIDVSQLCIQGNITVTPQAVRELMNRDIPICWFSYGGWFSGMAQGRTSTSGEPSSRPPRTSNSLLPPA